MKTIYSERYQHLLSLLRQARDAAEITQTELSERLAKPQSYVSKYERGERRLDVIEFLEVCQQINADPHKLIRDVTKNMGSS